MTFQEWTAAMLGRITAYGDAQPERAARYAITLAAELCKQADFWVPGSTDQWAPDVSTINGDYVLPDED